jgi:hypothetical protein
MGLWHGPPPAGAPFASLPPPPLTSVLHKPVVLPSGKPCGRLPHSVFIQPFFYACCACDHVRRVSLEHFL